MPHETLTKFGYPDSVITDYDHWAVLVRPKQVTLGCVVLACKEEATHLGAMSPDAFVEMKQVTAELQEALVTAFSVDKVNYLLLMMVDRYVHFHVVPRYSASRGLAGQEFQDAGWPKHPRMTEPTPVSGEQLERIRAKIAGSWPG